MNVFELRETFENEQTEELKEKLKNAAEAIVEMTKNFPQDITYKVWKENMETSVFVCGKKNEGVLVVFWGENEIGSFQYDDTAEKQLTQNLNERFPNFFKRIIGYNIVLSSEKKIIILIEHEKCEERLMNSRVFSKAIESCGFEVHDSILKKPHIVVEIPYKKQEIKKEQQKKEVSIWQFIKSFFV